MTQANITLTWIGNSCTLLTAPDETRIVSDPYHDDAHPPGLKPLPADLRADAVTVSHAHEDHSNAGAVGGSPRTITRAGTYQIGIVEITGYAGFEGSPEGPSHNPHVVFVFEAGGAKIVHLGDSGPITHPGVLSAIQNADAILFNIDGYVIPPRQIMPFLKLAKARTLIATHYSLSATARWKGAPTIEEFIKTLPSALPVIWPGSTIEITPGMPHQLAAMSPLMREE
jgi:L-ascorbate metabolism protein UlaG (beta-lactamase superfamily)